MSAGGRRAASTAGIRGTVEFDHGKLTNLSFSRGVKTARGVQVGRSTIAQMINAYTGGGLSASSAFDSTFAGTFVRVRKRHRDRSGLRVGRPASGSRPSRSSGR